MAPLPDPPDVDASEPVDDELVVVPEEPGKPRDDSMADVESAPDPAPR